MLTLRRKLQPQRDLDPPDADCKNRFITYNGCQFEYKLHVVDVDLKPVGKIPGYFQKDREIFLGE